MNVVGYEERDTIKLTLDCQPSSVHYAPLLDHFVPKVEREWRCVDGEERGTYMLRRRVGRR